MCVKARATARSAAGAVAQHADAGDARPGQLPARESVVPGDPGAAATLGRLGGCGAAVPGIERVPSDSGGGHPAECADDGRQRMSPCAIAHVLPW